MADIKEKKTTKTIKEKINEDAEALDIKENIDKDIEEVNAEEKTEGNDNKKEKDKKIYIGPNLLQLTTYTVVEDEFPEHVKDVITKCPSIENLFVNVTELAHYEKRAKTKGTLEYRNYIKIIEFTQGKGE